MNLYYLIQEIKASHIEYWYVFYKQFLIWVSFDLVQGKSRLDIPCTWVLIIKLGMLHLSNYKVDTCMYHMCEIDWSKIHWVYRNQYYLRVIRLGYDWFYYYCCNSSSISYQAACVWDYLCMRRFYPYCQRCMATLRPTKIIDRANKIT